MYAVILTPDDFPSDPSHRTVSAQSSTSVERFDDVETGLGPGGDPSAAPPASLRCCPASWSRFVRRALHPADRGFPPGRHDGNRARREVARAAVVSRGDLRELRIASGLVAEWLCHVLRLLAARPGRSKKKRSKTAPTPIVRSLLDELQPDYTVIAQGTNLLEGWPDKGEKSSRALLAVVAAAPTKCIWISPPSIRAVSEQKQTAYFEMISRVLPEYQVPAGRFAFVRRVPRVRR